VDFAYNPPDKVGDLHRSLYQRFLVVKMLEGVGNVRKSIMCYPFDFHCVAYLVDSHIGQRYGVRGFTDFQFSMGAPYSKTIHDTTPASIIEMLDSDGVMKLRTEPPARFIIYPEESRKIPGRGDVKEVERRHAALSLAIKTPLGERGVADIVQQAEKFAALDINHLYEVARERFFNEHGGAREEYEKSFVSISNFPELAAYLNGVGVVDGS